MLKLTYSKELHIYYISDLHLDQKRDKNKIKIKIKDKYIKEQANNLIRSLDNSDSGILYILGDIAEDFSIAKNFLEVLANDYHGQIIYCLGNHEYYAMKKDKKEFENFREELYNLGIIIIGIKGILFTIDEKNRIGLFKQDEDLYSIKYLCYCTTGCGVKDLAHSITCNEEKEKEIAKRQNEEYNKAIEISKKINVPILIAMHYDPNTWIEHIIYDKNIYYLHGHTHWNTFKKELNIYANAQIGYELIPCQCKELYIEEARHKFEDFKNGIHQIELMDYYSFITKKCSFSMDAPKSDNSYWNGNIYMIKKDGYYMFFIESKCTKKLSILYGGKKNKAQYNLDYYYTHFEEQIKLQCYYLKDWYDYMKKISNYIKTLGGTGYIHGSIIDIDFLNHVFVNPLDGTIMPYNAPMTTNGIIERFAYKSIPELIIKKCPEIAVNVNKYQIDFPLKYPIIIKNNNTPLSKEENYIMDYKLNREIGHKVQRAIENNIISTWIENNIYENNLLTY